MKEHPIIFSGPMVRAILAGTKTQTRRIVRADCQGYEKLDLGERGILYQGGMREQAWTKGGRWVRAPYAPGDRLWVREALRKSREYPGFGFGVKYDADYVQTAHAAGCPTGYCGRALWPWKSTHLTGRYCPRWASRLTLEVTEVCVHRLQEISEEDAKAEGMEFHDGRGVGCSGYRHSRDHGYVYETAARAFAVAWDSINGKRAPWESNPWVWAIRFGRAPA